MNYEENLQKLEQIVADLEQGNLPLDNLSECIQLAQELLAKCRQTLDGVTDDVNKILQPDNQQNA